MPEPPPSATSRPGTRTCVPDVDAQTAYDNGNALLTEAGLEAGFAGFGDGEGASTWTSDEFTVYFTVGKNDDGAVSVDYAISTN